MKNLDLDSALARDVNENITIWGSTLKTNYLLADIFDVLSSIHYALIKMSGGKASKPKPYPRPDNNKTMKKYGKGALKVNDLKDWIFKRNKKS